MTSPGQDKPLIFDWGDGSPLTPAAYYETVEHAYPGPGTYLITVREAATDLVAYTTYAYVADVTVPVLTVDDATVQTCQPSPFNATLTNGFGEVQNVFSYTTLLGAGITAANTLWQRQDPDGTWVTLPATDIPGGIKVIGGPFTVERDADTVVNLQVRLPSTAAATLTGHVDYVTSAVEDPLTGISALNVLISDDYTLTVTAGDCSSPPTPGTCSLSGIVPDANVPVYDDDGNQTGTTSVPVGTGQGVQLTGLGLINVAAMIAITDAGDGFPLQAVAYTEVDDPDNPPATIQYASGIIGLLPCVDSMHITKILVQDALNTTRCSMTVDWLYTPGPVPGLPADVLDEDTIPEVPDSSGYYADMPMIEPDLTGGGGGI